jgi:hypothetical protein
MTEQPDYSYLREPVLAMLADGEATPSELANVIGISRQLVHYWMAKDDVTDWQSARLDRVAAGLTERLKPQRRRHR